MAVSVLLHIALLFHLYLVHSCTRHDDETGTCYIDRQQKWHSSHGNISCDPHYPNCIITCFGDPYSCGTQQTQSDSIPHILFANTTQQCTLNCDSNDACHGSVILTHNCAFVNINVLGMDQSSMRIYAPNNNGYLFIDLLTEQTSFTNNEIICSDSTASVILNCELGVSCHKNVIRATTVTHTLQYKCNNYCDSTHIFCPANGDCNIQCKDSCNNMEIHTGNDMNNFHFICDSQQCHNTIIECMVNDTVFQSQYNTLPCSDSEAMIMAYDSLKMYLYYNESSKYDMHTFTELMHDTFIETFHIINHNIYYQSYHHIFGDLINITFCVNDNCDMFDTQNNKFKSQYIAYAMLYVSSLPNSMDLYIQYLIDIISSDKFLQYFNQNMNIKLFSMNEFQCIAIDINDNIVFVDTINVDIDIDIDSAHTLISPNHRVGFVMIGIICGVIFTLSVGYGMYKHCEYDTFLSKINLKTHKQIATNDCDDNNEIEIESENHSMANQSCSNLNVSSNERIVNKSPMHWGFTDANAKYGEIKEDNAFDNDNDTETDNEPLQYKNRTRILSDSVHSEIHSRHSLSHNTKDEMNENSDSKEEKLENEFVYNRQRSRTLNMEDAIKKHPFYNQRFNKRNKKSPHSNNRTPNSRNRSYFHSSVRSLSSVDISELFHSPTYSYMSKEGHYTQNHNNYQTYANTMPVFSLQFGAAVNDEPLMEISNVSGDASTTVETMDDDLDDYHTKNGSVMPMDTIDEMHIIDDLELNQKFENGNETEIANITPMLRSQNQMNSIHKLLSHNIDSEPELPLSPCQSASPMPLSPSHSYSYPL